MPAGCFCVFTVRDEASGVDLPHGAIQRGPVLFSKGLYFPSKVTSPRDPPSVTVAVTILMTLNI